MLLEFSNHSLWDHAWRLYGILAVWSQFYSFGSTIQVNKIQITFNWLPLVIHTYRKPRLSPRQTLCYRASLSPIKQLLLYCSFDRFQCAPSILDEEFHSDGNILEVTMHSSRLHSSQVAETDALMGESWTAVLAEGSCNCVPACCFGFKIPDSLSCDMELGILNEYVGRVSSAWRFLTVLASENISSALFYIELGNKQCSDRLSGSHALSRLRRWLFRRGKILWWSFWGVCMRWTRDMHLISTLWAFIRFLGAELPVKGKWRH